MTGTPQGARAGFDVPAQGLHLMPAGEDGNGMGIHRGALDTTRGPLFIEVRIDPEGKRPPIGMGSSEMLPHQDADRDAHPFEAVVSVEEQFVELVPQDGRYVGRMESSIGMWRIVDQDGRFTLETE